MIIDERSKEIEEALASLSFSSRILEFKTFRREGSDVRIYLFDTLEETSPKPPPPIEVPKGLEQVLEVVELVWFERKSYNDAIKIVAKKRGIRPETVRDKYTRGLGLNTYQFKSLLRNREELIAHLIKRYPDYEDYIIRRLSRKL